jgi:hypothetical protein
MDQKEIEAAVVAFGFSLLGWPLILMPIFMSLRKLQRWRFFKLRMQSRRFLEWGLSLYGNIGLGII